ncbi:type VI secretion protein [Erythrobacter litoralis]|uniref:TrbG/VirB9 family P-type conjugative transfer protein n=1 Tax=Erythrobacter litoralis TaxID=39960 RepID=UPI0024353875|nr:TrbG/VirB9 family P-type conjugative transfer protein [Erythrobacter litoralis]MDG6077780.1 type VI secretion protein [Erythrobacter litoralis]
MIRVSASLLAITLAGMAAAPAHADARLSQVMYDEAKVFRLDGKLNVQASIVFGDDEVIENVAIGNSQTWQVTPNKRANILFVKPLEARATTNLTVVTSKRTYLFDLVAGPSAKPLYVLRFDYPPEPEKPADAQLASADGTEAAAPNAPADPIETVDPSDLNFAWSAEGDANLLPQQTFDDGNATFLTWSEGTAVPAILVTNSEGTEGPVNFTVRDDVIVIDGVPRIIVLRAGEDSATLTNTGPVRASASSQSGAPAALASRKAD